MNLSLPESVSASVAAATGHVKETLAEVNEKLAVVKPKLRGWLHAGTAPLALTAGIVLIVLSPTASSRIGSITFTTTGLVLFTVSAIYHRGNWSPRVELLLKRFDHSNIFLLIAGSNTPFALILLDRSDCTVLLSVVWGGAIAGVLMKMFVPTAPRWTHAPIYIALGWAPVFFLPQMFSGARDLGVGVGTAVFVLLLVGGGLYTIGGIIYGTKFPNPSPRWFGFHEVFHSFTILAFASHYVGLSLATYSLR